MLSASCHISTHQRVGFTTGENTALTVGEEGVQLGAARLERLRDKVLLVLRCEWDAKSHTCS